MTWRIEWSPAAAVEAEAEAIGAAMIRNRSQRLLYCGCWPPCCDGSPIPRSVGAAFDAPVRPAELPEGAAAEVRLLLSDDAVSDSERAEIDAQVERGVEDFERGDFVDARELAQRLLAPPGRS